MNSRAIVWCVLPAVVMAAFGAGAEETVRQSAVQDAARARANMQELWRASVQAPAATATSQELRRLIAEVRAIELGPAAVTVAGAASAPEQTRSVVVGQVPQPAQLPAALDQAALERLGGLKPGQVPDAASLADALVGAGQNELAQRFYEMALSSQTDRQEQAWLLFRMANCIKAHDPAAARGLLRRIVSEYSEAPWAPAAAVQERLLEWHQQSQARAILQDCAAATTQPAQ